MKEYLFHFNITLLHQIQSEEMQIPPAPSPLTRPLCHILSPPPTLTPLNQSLSQEKQRQMFQEHTTALNPTPNTSHL